MPVTSTAGARRGGAGSRVLALGTLPVAAAALTATVALYLVLVVVGNLTDFGTNQQFVRHVLAMDTTFHDKNLMWRAITSPVLQDTAYVAIIAWEALSALVLAAATAWWLPALRHRDFTRARRASTLGLVLTLLLFGVGFIAIGGEWFAMWQSKAWNGLDAAIRNVPLAGLALVVVQLPSPHWPPDSERFLTQQ